MKTINRKSKEVILNGGRSVQRFYIVVREYNIYFTAAVTRYCEIEEGLYVHFLNEGDVWNFYINDDPDGFKLTPARAKKGFHINNTGLTRMILKSMGFKDQKRFRIEKTTRFHDRCVVYSLSTENVSTVIK